MCGFNNVDIKELRKRVLVGSSGYSRRQWQEHTLWLLPLQVTDTFIRDTSRLENNFSLVGLTGLNFFKKTAGIMAQERLETAMCRICKGFGMRVIAYDIYQNLIWIS